MIKLLQIVLCITWPSNDCLLIKLRELPLFSMDADNSLYENLENYLFTFIRVLFCLCAVNILRFAGILHPYLNRLCSEESAIMCGNHA